MAFENSFQNGAFSTIIEPRRSMKKHKRCLSENAELLERNSDSTLNTTTKHKHADDVTDISKKRKSNWWTEENNLSPKKSKHKRSHQITEDFDTSCVTENTVDNGVTLNSDVNYGSSTFTKKKKKKRSESYETLEETVCVNKSYEKHELLKGIHKNVAKVIEKKKKKKKRPSHVEIDATEMGSEQQSFISPEIDGNSNIGMSSDNASDYVIEKNKEKKKKKKQRNHEEIDASETINDELLKGIHKNVAKVIEKKKNKKKRRSHEEIDATEMGSEQQSFISPEIDRNSNVGVKSEDASDYVIEKNKEKKKKQRNHEEIDASEAINDELQQQSFISPETDRNSIVAMTSHTTEKKKKKNKKIETGNDEANSEDDNSVSARRKKDAIRLLKEIQSKVKRRLTLSKTVNRDSDIFSTPTNKNNNNNNNINVKREQTEDELNERTIRSQDLFSQSSIVEQYSDVDANESSTNDHVENSPEDNTEYQSLDTLNIVLEGIPPLHTRTLVRPGAEEIRCLRAEGVCVKVGLWSLEEVLKLKSNWKKLHETYPDYNMTQLLFTKAHLATKRQMLQFLGQGLNSRSLRSIYDKSRDVFGKTVEGRYSKFEKNKVGALIRENGKKWSVIAKSLDRSAFSVRDLIRKTKINSETHNFGPWTDDENDTLAAAVKKFVGADNFKADNKNVYIGLPWQKIARFVRTRNDTQCRQQWLYRGYEILLSELEIDRIKNWNTDDSLKLIECMKEQKVDNHNEIDWFKLAQRFRPINMYVLRMKYLSLKYLIVDYKKKKLKDILNKLTAALQ